MDEAHELYAQDEDGLWALPILRLGACTRWGLTGTPPAVDEDIHGASQLLGAHLGPAVNTELVEDFLAKCAHRSSHTADTFDLPPPCEEVVNVRMAPQEWVLYRQGLHERATELRKGDFGAYEEMLQLCSYFTLRRHEFNHEEGPEAEAKRELASKWPMLLRNRASLQNY